jgi:hypothetical protein
VCGFQECFLQDVCFLQEANVLNFATQVGSELKGKGGKAEASVTFLFDVALQWVEGIQPVCTLRQLPESPGEGQAAHSTAPSTAPHGTTTGVSHSPECCSPLLVPLTGDPPPPPPLLLEAFSLCLMVSELDLLLSGICQWETGEVQPGTLRSETSGLSWHRNYLNICSLFPCQVSQQRGCPI